MGDITTKCCRPDDELQVYFTNEQGQNSPIIRKQPKSLYVTTNNNPFRSVNTNSETMSSNNLMCSINPVNTNYFGNNMPNLNMINSATKIQKTYRGFISRKNLDNDLDLLSNIFNLDINVNRVINVKLAERLVKENRGEIYYQELLKENKIKAFQDETDDIFTQKNTKMLPLLKYKNINNYFTSKYIIETPLIYVDKFENDNLYEGSISLEKKFYGFGVLYSKKSRYEGTWRNGKLDGIGRIFYANREYFSGNFEKNKANGYGKYIHNDGTIYIGDWKDDFPNGQGEEIYVDESSFNGTFVNGNKKKGTFKWNDKSTYIGEIENDLFNGIGIFRWPEGKTYEGGWKDGKMHGKGKMTYKDNSYYDGEFQNGKRHGYGKYFWNECKYYEGYWSNNKQNGTGTYYKNGNRFNGIWNMGRPINDNLRISSSVSTFGLSETQSINSSSAFLGQVAENLINKNKGHVYKNLNRDPSYEITPTHFKNKKNNFTYTGGKKLESNSRLSSTSNINNKDIQGDESVESNNDVIVEHVNSSGNEFTIGKIKKNTCESYNDKIKDKENIDKNNNVINMNCKNYEKSKKKKKNKAIKKKINKIDKNLNDENDMNNFNDENETEN